MKRKVSVIAGRAVSALCGTAGTVAMLASPGPAQGYTEKALYSFCSVGSLCKDGSGPSGLVMDPSGNLFGVTESGGKHGAGVVFEFVPSSGQFMVLHSFCSKVKISKKSHCLDGQEPGRVNLVVDVNGNLYGTTTYGGNSQNAGVVFELQRTDTGWHEVTLYRFCSQTHCADGAWPQDGLTYAGAASGQLYDGNSPLFGTTEIDGADDGGTVFSLSPSGSNHWSEQVLYSFCSQTNCADGNNPDTPLYLDAQGTIYGTTIFGGQGNDAGVVFELTPNGSGYSESVLYSFCQQTNCTDGENAYGGVVMDQSGNLVGTAGEGGSGADGLLFELSPDSGNWQYNVLDNFNGANGGGPVGLIIDGSGNLFGTTYSGGAKNDGTVFQFSGSIQSLYSFCPTKGCADGKYPFTGVVEDGAGNLYGVTAEGGSGHNGGTLYELSP